MLGQFLEFSFTARPIAASYEFYLSLGFRSIAVGDLLSEPAAAFYDGAIAIGLHDGDSQSPILTFVRPQLRDYVRGIRRLGVEVGHVHLADDEFHQVDFVDPSNQSVRLLEARTFPPGDWDRRNVSACGEFLEYSIPTESIDVSRAFWEGFGFVPVASGESPHAWLRLTGRGLTLGLHEARFHPGLSFRAKHVAARFDYLKAKNVTLKAGSPLAEHAQPSATVLAPEGTALYLLEGSVAEA
jgi:hypothetical protein